MALLQRLQSAGSAFFASSSAPSAVPFGGAASGYDAVRGKGKRQPPSSRVLSEDQELRQMQRRLMTTSTRDLQRNFAIAAWAIRKHIDFLTSFTFQSKTQNKLLDEAIEAFIAWWSKPLNFDAAGRHGLRRFLRLVEARRTLDGDVLVNRLADGRVQGIEGDRVQTDGGTPYAALGIDATKVVNGVFLNDNGRAISYMVFRRPFNNTGLVWDRAVSATYSDLVGYYDRFDQVRGISPLAPGINTLRDVYENFDYALAKSKVAQLFALAIYRENSDEMGIPGEYPTAAPVAPAATAEGGDCPPTGKEQKGYDIDFGKGPMVLDLDPGDRAELLMDQTPSTQFQAFTQSMIMVAIKALDIPFSFYDEAHTNWVGQRQANSQYMLSATAKRADLVDLLDKITQWRLGLAVMDGDLKLPKGMKVADLNWEWVPAGTPPVDPVKEITADVAEINAGLSSPQRKCRERGDDFFQVIDERAVAEKYARGKGVILSTALPANTMDDPNNSKTQVEDQQEEPIDGKQKH